MLFGVRAVPGGVAIGFGRAVQRWFGHGRVVTLDVHISASFQPSIRSVKTSEHLLDSGLSSNEVYSDPRGPLGK